MRVSSPQVRATLMPPPPGICRSHTTRSGWCARMAATASSALPASATTQKLPPRSARTPSRQIGWSSASTTCTIELAIPGYSAGRTLPT